MTVVESVNGKVGVVTLTAANVGAIPTTETAGGATAATYGRTSTIAAPVLRDVVSILDFAGPTNGNGTTDDTSIFTAAIAAIKAVGAGTLIVTPHNLTGALATWVIGKVEICSNLTLSMYGARFVGKAGYAHQLFGNEFNGGEKGKIQHENVRFYGGLFQGTGNEAANQAVFHANRTRDVTIRDVEVTNWASTTGEAPVFMLVDACRPRIEGNTLIKCCASKGKAFNAIQANAVGSFGEATTPYTEVVVNNNIVTGGGAACICINLGFEDTYVNSVPTRAVISGNIVESTEWNPIILEIGGGTESKYPLGTIEQVIISNNIASYTGPNSGSVYAVNVVNDSSPELLTSPLIFTDIKISNNVLESARNGIGCEASRATLENNTVTAVNAGIFCRGVGATPTATTHVHIKGGIVRMRGEGKASGIWLNTVTDASIDTDVYFETGTEADSKSENKGIFLQTCSRIDVNAKISYAPRQGILIEGGGNIHINPGTRIYNPASNAANPGIEAKKVTGPVWVEGVNVRDDRGGSAKMTYGIVNTSPEAGGLVYSLRNKYVGYTKASPWNGTMTTQLHDIVDETGVVWTAGKRETWGTEAPKASTWAAGDVCWNVKPAAGGTPFWVCTTAGTPGTWQKLKLEP
jgi:hypothetical protein